jgi:hypothetical protein
MLLKEKLFLDLKNVVKGKAILRSVKMLLKEKLFLDL